MRGGGQHRHLNACGPDRPVATCWIFVYILGLSQLSLPNCTKYSHLIPVDFCIPPLNCQKLISASICSCHDPATTNTTRSRLRFSTDIWSNASTDDIIWLLLTQYFSGEGSIFKRLFSAAHNTKKRREGDE